MNRLERATSSSSAFDDDAVYSARGSECFDMDLDEEEALRKAARAGILLLETNKELQEEVTALRDQVAALESERPRMRSELRARDQELESLKADRKRAVVEANALRNELKAKSSLVTDLLEHEDTLRQQIEEAQSAKMQAENELAALIVDMEQQQKMEAAMTEGSDRNNLAVPNPAATYDSNQASIFTFADYEKMQHRLQLTAEENEVRALEVKSLRKESEALRRKVAKLPECLAHIERLEKRNEKLQSSNETLQEERMEERAVFDSLRSMNLVYKKIAESRPFTADCTCSQHPEEADPQALGVTVRDVLIDTNMKLEAELRELRAAMHLPQIKSENDGEEALEQVLRRVGSNSSNGSASSDTASSSGGDSTDMAHERLIRKVQTITEKLNLSRDMLRHTKVQWCAAVASQKALEECNKSAQEEISRLTQQLDSQIASLASSDNTDPDHRERQINAIVEGDETSKWAEETAPYPAPPGDLNSPLIRCLLDHWTTDKSKVMMLTDWLHNSIRGTGRATPLRLLNLKSEIAAGFMQLLVPIMRERHGVSVSIYRRDSVHVLTDLVLQTNHASVTVQNCSTEPTVATKGDAVSVHPRDPEETGEPELGTAPRANGVSLATAS